MQLSNLRHLKVFDAVARLGSFVEASRALHMTPAAVSLAIRDLEASVGFKVFERTTRNVKLSEAGRQLIIQVERVLMELRSAEGYVASLRAGAKTTVRIATTPPVISSLLGALFERAPDLWPTVRITTVEVSTAQIFDAVNTRLADIAIGVHLSDDDETDTMPLFQSRWVAMVPPSHPIADRTVLTWSEIMSEPLLVINESSRLRIQSALPANIYLHNVQIVSTAMFALASAACGHGIAIIPNYIRPLSQVHNLTVIPITQPDIHHLLEIGIAKRPKPEQHVLDARNFLVENVQKVYAALA